MPKVGGKALHKLRAFTIKILTEHVLFTEKNNTSITVTDLEEDENMKYTAVFKIKPKQDRNTFNTLNKNKIALLALRI